MAYTRGTTRPHHPGSVARSLPRCILLVVAVGMLMVATAAPARAHPVVLFTDPELDSAVSTPPSSVTLVFNERVTIGQRAIIVSDTRGREVTVNKATQAKGGTVVTAKLDQKLTSGTYRVQWEVTGTDGHGATGEYRFAVGTAVAGASGGAAQPTDWVAAGIRWVLLVGFTVAFGGLIGDRIVTTARRTSPALPPIRPWAHYGAAVSLVAAAAAGTSLVTDIGSPSALWQGTAGRVVLTEAAGSILALILLAAGRRSLALLPLFAIPVAQGIGSHANVAVPIAGAALTGVHLAAAACWIGTLVQVSRATVGWRSDPAAIGRAFLAYAQMAIWVFVAVAATGLTMALLMVPLSALTTTSYGRALMIKLALVAAVTGLAIVGRRALRRRHIETLTKTARAEVVTMAAVLTATAVLVSTPTPNPANAPPPPPAKGVPVPAGGLAGQIGVNVVASQGQVVVRLYTPRSGNYYGPRTRPRYRLAGRLQPAEGPATPVDFRSCGNGCFVAPLKWGDGTNLLNLHAEASGWKGGNFVATIPWPGEPAKDLVTRTVRVMRDLEKFTVYEAGTSNMQAGMPEPQQLTVDGKTLLSNEPYNSGVAPIAVQTETEDGSTRLLMGFPGSGMFTAVTLDGLGRITNETLTGPKHVFKRRILYPE